MSALIESVKKYKKDPKQTFANHYIKTIMEYNYSRMKSWEVSDRWKTKQVRFLKSLKYKRKSYSHLQYLI